MSKIWVAEDLEYIPEFTTMGSEPPPARPNTRTTYCEIMQIGACRLDENGSEVDVFNRIVSAYRLHRIPEWLTVMTGITPERREQEGVPLAQALVELSIFIGCAEDVYTFNADGNVYAANAKEQGVTLPFPKPLIRVKPLLEEQGITLADYQRIGATEVCSGDLHKVLGIELPEVIGVGTHDAAHDARSLAHSVYHLFGRKSD